MRRRMPPGAAVCQWTALTFLPSPHFGRSSTTAPPVTTVSRRPVSSQKQRPSSAVLASLPPVPPAGAPKGNCTRCTPTHALSWGSWSGTPHSAVTTPPPRRTTSKAPTSPATCGTPLSKHTRSCAPATSRCTAHRTRRPGSPLPSKQPKQPRAQALLSPAWRSCTWPRHTPCCGRPRTANARSPAQNADSTTRTAATLPPTWYRPPSSVASQATCYLSLGDHQRAECLLASTAEKLRDRRKSRAIVLGNLTLARIRQRDVEAGVASLTEAIAELETTRGGGGLNHVFGAARELRPWRQEPIVAEVHDRLLALMTAA